MLVGRRRRLLDYLKKKDQARYETLIGRLGLRRSAASLTEPGANGGAYGAITPRIDAAASADRDGAFGHMVAVVCRAAMPPETPHPPWLNGIRRDLKDRMMFNHFRKELDWGGRKLVLETGKIARQADGAVMVSYGDTIVLCTAVGVKTAKPGQDFFPLTVNYQEKAFAAGKIPGGFFKREGRPSEKETLVSRLIDRPIRPLFPAGFRNEVQIVATVLSHDMENDPDIVALIGCSAALTLSGIPFFGPVGAARVGYIDGHYVLNPTLDQMKGFKLDLVLAGTTEGVLMVESEAYELSEEVMLGAVSSAMPGSSR